GISSDDADCEAHAAGPHAHRRGLGTGRGMALSSGAGIPDVAAAVGDQPVHVDDGAANPRRARAAVTNELLTSPAAERNKDPILTVLETLLPPAGRVLEIASGTGQHVCFSAAEMPGIRW